MMPDNDDDDYPRTRVANMLQNPHTLFYFCMLPPFLLRPLSIYVVVVKPINGRGGWGI